MSTFMILDRVAHIDHEEVLTVVEIKPSEQPHYSGMLYAGVHVAEYKPDILVVSDSNGLTFPVKDTDCTFISRMKTRSKYDDLAMYIIVKDTVPTGLGVNGAVHAGYIAAKTFNSPLHEEWEKNSFRKRTCIVTEEEYDLAIEEIKRVGGNFIEFNENDWHDQNIAAAFEARYSWPPIFKQIKLHSSEVK